MTPLGTWRLGMKSIIINSTLNFEFFEPIPFSPEIWLLIVILLLRFSEKNLRQNKQ